MARYDIPPSEFDIAGARIGIVAARFNDDIVSPLLEAALDTLARHGLDRDGIPVARVPGAFELPLAARWLATCYRPLTDIGDPDRSREERRTDRGTTLPDDEHAGEDGMAARGRQGTTLPDDEHAGEDDVAAQGRQGTTLPDDEHADEDRGSREKPRIVRNVMIARNATADAVIALGAVIRGDTPHFDYVCAEAARGIRAVSLELDVPIIFGVLTCDDHVQALERAGGGPAPSAPSTRGDSADPSGFDPSNPDISDSASRSRPAATGSGHRNKGCEAALAALEMVSLRRRLGA